MLVLGGTGFVGAPACEKLVERSGGAGGRIVVPTRPPGPRAPRAVAADRAARRCRRARRCARLAAPGGRHATRWSTWSPSCMATTPRSRRCTSTLPRRLAQACSAAGVRRVVHVSALGAATDAPSRYLRSQGRGRAGAARPGLDLTRAAPVGDLRRRGPLPEPVRHAAGGASPVMPLAARRRSSSRCGSKTWRRDRALPGPIAATIGQTYRMRRSGVLHAARAGATGRAAVGPCAPGDRAARRAGARCRRWCWNCCPARP